MNDLFQNLEKYLDPSQTVLLGGKLSWDERSRDMADPFNYLSICSSNNRTDFFN